ncbi:hypothetical protein GGI04_005757, partial [Coemansia thaxteri]
NDEGLTPVDTTLENEATEVTKLICDKLGIPMPDLQASQVIEQPDEAHGEDNEDDVGHAGIRDDSMSESKLENLSNWIMQQVDDNNETDEEALREMVTKYIMQNLRISGGSNADDTVAATVATSTDRVSQDNDSASGLPPASK